LNLHESQSSLSNSVFSDFLFSSSDPAPQNSGSQDIATSARREDLPSHGGFHVEVDHDAKDTIQKPFEFPKANQEDHGGTGSRKESANTSSSERKRHNPGALVVYVCDDADCKAVKFHSKAQWT
jgi:hypothetical protein